MHVFLNAQVAGIRGLNIPMTDQQLIDVEFVDDTTLYVEGSQVNLNVVQNAITIFCKGARIKVNWQKGSCENEQTVPTLAA